MNIKSSRTEFARDMCKDNYQWLKRLPVVYFKLVSRKNSRYTYGSLYQSEPIVQAFIVIANQ